MRCRCCTLVTTVFPEYYLLISVFCMQDGSYVPACAVASRATSSSTCCSTFRLCKLIFAPVDAKTAIDRRGGDVAHAGQSDLTGVARCRPASGRCRTSTRWCLLAQQGSGRRGQCVVLWDCGRNFDLPRERRKVFSLRIDRRHGEDLLCSLNFLHN